MGRGLSPLQRQILAALDEFAKPVYPKQIRDCLDRAPTPSNRAAVSKALDRLLARGLIGSARANFTRGKAYRYASLRHSSGGDVT